MPDYQKDVLFGRFFALYGSLCNNRFDNFRNIKEVVVPEFILIALMVIGLVTLIGGITLSLDGSGTALLFVLAGGVLAALSISAIVRLENTEAKNGLKKTYPDLMIIRVFDDGQSVEYFTSDRKSKCSGDVDQVDGSYVINVTSMNSSCIKVLN